MISKDGYIFERRLIEGIIEKKGTCPITGSPLALGDLKPVQSMCLHANFSGIFRFEWAESCNNFFDESALYDRNV